MSEIILVVEDEEDLNSVIVYNLRQEALQTRSATTAKEALEEALQQPLPDLIILDLMLPDQSGLEVCKQLRLNPQTRSIPIIMLTAKGEEIDRVVGLEMGADDYIVKPFSLRELLLRVKAVLRRTSKEDEPEDQRVTFGKLRIDKSAHQVWVEDDEVRLTALEFRLLLTLFERKGRVQSRDILLSDVWQIDSYIDTRTVDTHVKRLREKLGQAGPYVETVRGVGYRFCSHIESV